VLVKIFFATISMALTACAYDASFSDCTINCSATSGCPDGFSCSTSEGLCRSGAATLSCAAIVDGGGGNDGNRDGGSDGGTTRCSGLAATCGSTASDDCCSIATTIPGGTFYRSYDVAADGMYPSTSYPATVSAFVLDKYEVTVGRFRQFVDASQGTQAKPPMSGAGAHAKIAGSGWDSSWNGSLVANQAALVASVKCDATYQTWTDTAGANEALPINCITWYEAMAFCIWDGGYLPTEAEWNYAAAGGNEQRAYPWSSPASSTAIDCSYANYDVNVPSGTYCVNGTAGGVNRVGSESPKGDGKWGQADLSGNVWEWTFDWYQSPYVNPCNDCTNLTPTSNRVFHGGSFGDGSIVLREANRSPAPPTHRGGYDGARCAH
jgi:formylglycine-generating enzyme